MLLPAAVALALSSASAYRLDSPTADRPSIDAPAVAQASPGALARAEPGAPGQLSAPVHVRLVLASARPGRLSLAPEGPLHLAADSALAPAATASPRIDAAPDTHADTPPSAKTPGAAQPPSDNDPFQSLNRRFFGINQGLDRTFMGPTARLYKHHTPGAFQRMLHNFVTNFGEPVVLANDILQLRPKRAMTSAFRFIVNSTAGIGGLFDPAKRAGAAYHDNDFGITLGRYGAPSGPYLYIPFIGPSDVRDALGKAVDGFLIDPLNWAGYEKVLYPAHPPRHPYPYFHHEDEIPHRNTIRIGEAVMSTIDERARVDDELNTLMSTATDPYATLRSVYLQNRAAEVNQAQWRHSDLPDDFDSPPDPGASPAAAPAPAPAQPVPATAREPTATAPAAPVAVKGAPGV